MCGDCWLENGNPFNCKCETNDELHENRPKIPNATRQLALDLDALHFRQHGINVGVDKAPCKPA